MNTPREAMYMVTKIVADVENLQRLPLLALGRCGDDQGRCRNPVAYLYNTRLGPLLIAIVPDEEHDLAVIENLQARREFAGTRDHLLGARSEWDLVDHTLEEHDRWHPVIPYVQCSDHLRPFDRDAFVSVGRLIRGRAINIKV